MTSITARLRSSRVVVRGTGACLLAAILALTPARASAEMVCSQFTVYKTITFLGVVIWEGVYEEGFICRES